MDSTQNDRGELSMTPTKLDAAAITKVISEEKRRRSEQRALHNLAISAGYWMAWYPFSMVGVGGSGSWTVLWAAIGLPQWIGGGEADFCWKKSSANWCKVELNNAATPTNSRTSGLVVKSNVAIVGPRVRFSAGALIRHDVGGYHTCLSRRIPGFESLWRNF